MSRHRKGKRSKDAGRAAAPPAEVPPPVAPPQTVSPPPAVVALDMPPVPRAALVNTALVAVVVAAGAAMQQIFAPWLASIGMVVLTGGSVLFAFGIFKFFFDRELKTFVRMAMVPRRMRIAISVVLAAEVLLAVFLATRPPVRVIRLVPGPELNLQLGHTDQRLRVEVDGERFEIHSPPPRPFYAGASPAVVQELVRREDAQVREAVLNEVLKVSYQFYDAASMQPLRNQWLTGAPKILQPAEGTGGKGLTAVFIEGKTERVLEVRPIGTDDGIETHVIELR